MTEPVYANASPEKRLFISLLTRDITLVAAFLDLVDNSINSALEPFAESLRTADDYVATLGNEKIAPEMDISIHLSDDRIAVEDSATGISLRAARERVFRFGRPLDDEEPSDRLSVYGLGLKRAFFKLGTRVKMTSDHVDGGFELRLDVLQWSKEESTPWQFQISPRTKVSARDTGTKIEILDLHADVQMRLRGGTLEGELIQAVEKTYAYFLAKFVRVTVNGRSATTVPLRISENHASDRFGLDRVTCAVTAGIGTPDAGAYRDKDAGWFVFCNGRAVVNADKSALTGWNNNGLPIFQPKHRPFLGLVYFVSDHPERLPWDTTKSGISVDSMIWQRAKQSMVTIGKTVVSYLSSRYDDEGDSADKQDLVTLATQRVDGIATSVAPARPFSRPPSSTRSTIRIQYDAQINDVERIARHLARPGMSGSEVGRHVFDFFLRNEVETE